MIAKGDTKTETHENRIAVERRYICLNQSSSDNLNFHYVYLRFEKHITFKNILQEHTKIKDEEIFFSRTCSSAKTPSSFPFLLANFSSQSRAEESDGHALDYKL